MTDRCAASRAATSGATAPRSHARWPTLLAHRGPDAHGAVRLSTIRRVDVHARAPPALDHRPERRAADQPFSKDGLILVYNGELYNYRELRAELAAAGVQLPHVVRHRGRARGVAALGHRHASSASAGMFAFALLDERTGDLVARPRPARHQAAVLPATRDDGRVVFASELKAIARTLGPELEIDPAAARRVDPLLLGPRPAVRDRGTSRSCRRDRGPSSAPTARGACTATGTIAEVAARRRGRTARRSRSGHRGLGRRAPRRRRAGVDVPQRRPRLEHRDRARQAARSEHRRVHDHLPARGPAPRGDARRRASTRARSRARYGIALARDRDRARHRRAAAADRRRPRRADRRPRGDQHLAHLRERPASPA